MLTIPLHPVPTMAEAVEKILSAVHDKRFMHVVSLNPENSMTAQTDTTFAKVLSTDSMQIIDGTGVLLASRWTGEYQKGWQRVTGVDLMDTLIHRCGSNRKPLRICLLGGRNGVASQLAHRYQALYANLIVDAIDDADPSDSQLAKKVATLSPDLLFVAFGSPTQELWIDMHKDLFPHTVCMGVGGAFDMLSGRASRAPRFLRMFGLEWLYRLITQPWRWRRQLKLLQFIYLLVWSRYQKII